MRIVLVDDDPIDRMLLAQALRGVAAIVEILEFSDGETALAAMRLSPPAVTLVDAHMPGMSGLAFIAAIRADPNLTALPVVMISGSNQREELIRALDKGATAYFPKPDTINGYKTLAKTLRQRWLQKHTLAADYRNPLSVGA